MLLQGVIEQAISIYVNICRGWSTYCPLEDGFVSIQTVCYISAKFKDSLFRPTLQTLTLFTVAKLPQ